MRPLDAVQGRLKRLAERVLVVAGGPSFLRVLQRRRDVILAYHNVVPEGADPGGDGSLHLPRSEFALQLDHLTMSHRVVSLTDLLVPERAEGPRPRAAITFDDGYRGALTVGLKELNKRSMPATFFVCPGLLGAESVWWDALAVEGRRRLSESWSLDAQIAAAGVGEAVYRWAEKRGIGARPQPEHAGVVTEDELRLAAETAGVSLASHSWSHPNLTALDVAELDRELRRSLQWLSQRFPGPTVPFLSWPYGRSDAVTRRAARDAGYAGAFSIDAGLVGGESDRYEFPRVNVSSGLSLARFTLRTAGI